MNKNGLYSVFLIASMLLGANVANAETSTVNNLTGKAEEGELKVSAKDVNLGDLVIGESIPSKETKDLVSVTNNTGVADGVELLVRSNNYTIHKDNIKLSLNYDGKDNLITSSNRALEVFDTKIDTQSRDGSFSGEWGNYAKAGEYNNDLVWTVVPKITNYKDNVIGLMRSAQTSGLEFSYMLRHSFSGGSVSPSEISGFNSIASGFQGNNFMSVVSSGNVVTGTRSLSLDSLKNSYKYLKESGSYITINPNKNKEIYLTFDKDLWDKTINSNIDYPITYLNNNKVKLTVKSLVNEANYQKVSPSDYWSNNITDKEKAAIGFKPTSIYFNSSSDVGYVPLEAKNGEVYYLKIKYEAKP